MKFSRVRVWMRLQVLAAAFLCLQVLAGGQAHAQLATSFYNVTQIETRRLPNAVQVIIRTDGAVIFGGDYSEWVETSDDRFDAKPTTSFRLRLLRARSKLPAFVDIGAYPIDAASLTLGRDALHAPYFPAGAAEQPEPRVDIQLRFFVPILVQRFTVQKGNGDNDEIQLGSSVDPLDVTVSIGDDRRSIVVTAIPDRADNTAVERLTRVKREDQKQRLQVLAAGANRFQIDALHADLGQLLNELSGQSGLPIVASSALASERVTLRLTASLEEILRVLESGLGVDVQARPPQNGGGWSVNREENAPAQRLPLRYLKPERARLLFPDYLLPFLRVDIENNALISAATPVVTRKIARDLALLDVPRLQVKVTARLWEIISRDDFNFALRAAFGRVGITGNAALQFDSGGPLVARIDNGSESDLSSLQVTLEALRANGRARLGAQPFVTVLSGESGTLFLGQSRFVPVLRVRSGQQDVQALRVPVGTTLTVQPRVAPGGEVNVQISPRVSTIDDIERGSGLPTLGLREIETNIRARDGDTLLIAGLDNDVNERERGRSVGLVPSRRSNQEITHSIVLVQVQVLAGEAGALNGD